MVSNALDLLIIQPFGRPSRSKPVIGCPAYQNIFIPPANCLQSCRPVWFDLPSTPTGGGMKLHLNNSPSEPKREEKKRHAQWSEVMTNCNSQGESPLHIWDGTSLLQWTTDILEVDLLAEGLGTVCKCRAFFHPLEKNPTSIRTPLYFYPSFLGTTSEVCQHLPSQFWEPYLVVMKI